MDEQTYDIHSDTPVEIRSDLPISVAEMIFRDRSSIWVIRTSYGSTEEEEPDTNGA